jgi:hypothetical protein
MALQTHEKTGDWQRVDTLFICSECGQPFLALMRRPDGGSFLALGRYVGVNGKLYPEGNSAAPHICGDHK